MNRPEYIAFENVFEINPPSGFVEEAKGVPRARRRPFGLPAELCADATASSARAETKATPAVPDRQIEIEINAGNRATRRGL